MNTKLNPSGIEHEIAFWRQFVLTERFQDWLRPAPTPELSLAVQALIAAGVTAQGRPLLTLDVGSGPISILHGLPGVDVTACDPLSRLYQRIFDYSAHGIAPPAGFPAEDLPTEWADTFDLVHISNALDHTVDPEKALSSLLACCAKPSGDQEDSLILESSGGWLIVQGFVNEATYEHYQGFHQYNLELNEGYLQINGGFLQPGLPDGVGKTIAPADLGAELIWAWQGPLPTGKNWFIWVLERAQ